MRTLQDIRYSVANRIETYVTTNLGGLWKLVQRVPVIHRRVNRILIDRAILKIPTRPNPLSTKAAYTSWASLTDRTYDSRHLPPAEGEEPGHPPAEDVAALFNRQGETTPCQKSTFSIGCASGGRLLGMSSKSVSFAFTWRSGGSPDIAATLCTPGALLSDVMS